MEGSNSRQNRTSTVFYNNIIIIIDFCFVQVSRKGEAKRFKPFRALSNRMLLWHGSRTTNYAGILAQVPYRTYPIIPLPTYVPVAIARGVLVLCKIASNFIKERKTYPDRAKFTRFSLTFHEQEIEFKMSFPYSSYFIKRDLSMRFSNSWMIRVPTTMGPSFIP